MCGGAASRVRWSGGLSPQVLGVSRLPGAWGGGLGCAAVLWVRVALSGAALAWARRATGDRVAPPDLARLDVVGDHVLDGPGLPGLGNGQGPGMCGQERGGDAGQDQAGEQGDGQDVLLDLLAALGLGGAKDDALDAVVDAAARLEGGRVGGVGQVVEVGLEQPEGLRYRLLCVTGVGGARGLAPAGRR